MTVGYHYFYDTDRLYVDSVTVCGEAPDEPVVITDSDIDGPIAGSDDDGPIEISNTAA